MCSTLQLFPTRAAHDDQAELERLLAALNDSRPRVARAACEALAERFVVPRERLWKLLVTTRWPHTRLRALRLLARGERIDSMIWLLSAAVLGDVAVREQACIYLARWGDYWLPVASDRVADLSVALRRAAPVLPHALAENLWAYVRSAGGEAPPLAQRVGAMNVPPRRTKPEIVWATETRPPRYTMLNGRVLRRTYELTPRWRVPWKWRLPL